MLESDLDVEMTLSDLDLTLRELLIIGVVCDTGTGSLRMIP